MAPGILIRYRSWKSGNKMITPLRLGEMENDPDTKRPVRLFQKDDEHVGKIFAWLYKVFVGKELGATWFQTLFNKLNEDM